MPNDTTLIWVATRGDSATINILIIDLSDLQAKTPLRQGKFTNNWPIQTSKSLLLSEDNNYIYLGYVDSSFFSFGVAKLNYITNFTF